MTDQYVQIQPDSTGKKVDVSELTVGANTVERQRVVIANNSNAAAFASNFPAGFLRVSDEPTQIFYDAFDVSLDTTVRWNTPIFNGGGVSAAVASGSLTIGTGTSANGFSTLSSQPSFALTIPGWLGVSLTVQVENPVTVNGYRFWGCGSIPTVPTATAPLTDAIGFELYTDGKLYAVVYASGVRTVVQDLSSATGNSTQPTDANAHRYIVYVRTDLAYWYIDQLDTFAATSSFVAPTVQTLPLRFLSVAGASPPSPSCVTTLTGAAVWDTAKNNQTISDGTYGFRKATVTKAGALGVDASLGGPIQGTDGITQHPLMTDPFGKLLASDDSLELLRSICAELKAIRFGIAHMARIELNLRDFLDENRY